MTSIPKISVLLPVYNAARFLPESLASLQMQTCGDFEVVAVDDGSTDDSGQMLEQFASKHDWLRVFRQERAGIATALNHAFAMSRGEFIARMDADDIADRRRLEVQAEFLRANPSIGVCGSWVRNFGEGCDAVVRAPVNNDAIRAWLLFGSAFVHPAVMMRREILLLLRQPYESDAPPVEDYALWLALSERTQFHNLPRELLRYRIHPGQVTQGKSASAGQKLMQLRIDLLVRLGIHVTASELRAHAAVGFEPVDFGKAQAQEVEAWLERLCELVPATGWCSGQAVCVACADAWWRYMRENKGGLREAWIYGRSSLVKHTIRTFFRMARLALRW